VQRSLAMLTAVSVVTIAVASTSVLSAIRSDEQLGDAWQSTRNGGDLVEHQPPEPG
jgi:hypothetical protein